MFGKADPNGKVSFNLLQGAKVKIEVPGRTLDMIRICNIPSATSADLLDVLFPRVSSAAFDLSSLVISSGGSSALDITGTMSDGTTQSVGGVATLSTSDSAVVSVDGNVVKGVSAGSATIGITAIDQTELETGKEPDGDVIVRDNLPAPTLTSTIVITVTAG